MALLQGRTGGTQPVSVSLAEGIGKRLLGVMTPQQVEHVLRRLEDGRGDPVRIEIRRRGRHCEEVLAMPPYPEPVRR